MDIDASAELGKGFQIRIFGRNNRLLIGANTILGTGMIELRNSESSIKIGEDCVLNGSFRCRAGQTHLRVGDKTTMMMAHISLHEAGKITLGDNCMLSGDITMDVSDMHSILDVQSGERLAHGVRIMKGAQIGQDCIIGSRAMVFGEIPANSLAVGSPARVVRSGVTWDRRRIPKSNGAEIERAVI